MLSIFSIPFPQLLPMISAPAFCKLSAAFIALAGTWRLLVGGAAQTYYDGNPEILLVGLSALAYYFPKMDFLNNT
jgi:hypothetical protein